MKLVTAVAGIGIGTFALVGCSGTTPEDGLIALKTPTATISEQNTTALVEDLAFRLGVESFLDGGGASALGNSQKVRTTPSPSSDGMTFPEAGEQQCEVSGSTTLTYTKGTQTDVDNSTGDAEVEKAYNDCKDNFRLMNGKQSTEYKWTYTGDIRDTTWSKTITDYKEDYTDGDFYNEKQSSDKIVNYVDKAKETSKGNEEYSYTGNGKYDGWKWSIENEEFTSSWDNTKDIQNHTTSTRLSIEREEFGGWFTIETTTPFEEKITNGKRECLAGEAKITAANHNITVSCVDKKYVVKFDGVEVN